MDLFSISNEMSADEFVSRPICAIASCIPIVHRFTRKIHAQIREQKISCFFFVLFFSASKKNCHRHENGFGDKSFISLVCNRAKSSKKLFFEQ